MNRHLKLVPTLAQGHPHIRGEDTVEDAHNASLRSLNILLVGYFEVFLKVTFRMAFVTIYASS